MISYLSPYCKISILFVDIFCVISQYVSIFSPELSATCEIPNRIGEQYLIYKSTLSSTETMDQLTILSLPLSIWKLIMLSYYKLFVQQGIGGSLATLRNLVRCKSASKYLNQLLNDEFFCKTTLEHKMRKYYYKKN